MNLFATAALRKRLHIRTEECSIIDPPDPVHSWYGHVQQVSRTKLVLLVHATTRYSVVFEAKGILSTEALHERWTRALPRVAELDGVARRSLDPLLEHGPLRIAKAVDRRVLGTITEWFRMIRLAPPDRALDPMRLSHWLNHTPIIGGKVGFPYLRFPSLVAQTFVPESGRTTWKITRLLRLGDDAPDRAAAFTRHIDHGLIQRRGIR